jgi:uncharacterized protein (UPF0297 family)
MKNFKQGIALALVLTLVLSMAPNLGLGMIEAEAETAEDVLVEFTKTFGGSQSDVLRKIIKSNNGNGYVGVGYSQSNDHDFLDGNNGNYDIFVVKFDETGNIIFLKTFGTSDTDYGFDIVSTNDGQGYLVVGAASLSELDITDGNNGENDLLLLQIDENGNKEFDKTIGGSLSERGFNVISTNDRLGYLIAGDSRSSSGDITDNNNGSYDVLIFKVDEEGKKVFDKTLGGL